MSPDEDADPDDGYWIIDTHIGELGIQITFRQPKDYGHKQVILKEVPEEHAAWLSKIVTSYNIEDFSLGEIRFFKYQGQATYVRAKK